MIATLWDLLFCSVHGVVRPETWPLIQPAFMAAARLWRRGRMKGAHV